MLQTQERRLSSTYFTLRKLMSDCTCLDHFK